jgi:hypothetical protein
LKITDLEKFIFLLRKVIKFWREKLPHAVKPNEYIKKLQRNEVFMLSELEHEDIIKYFDFFLEKDHVCAVLEYCEVNLMNQKFVFFFNNF